MDQKYSNEEPQMDLGGWVSDNLAKMGGLQPEQDGKETKSDETKGDNGRVVVGNFAKSSAETRKKNQRMAPRDRSNQGFRDERQIFVPTKPSSRKRPQTAPASRYVDMGKDRILQTEAFPDDMPGDESYVMNITGVEMPEVTEKPKSSSASIFKKTSSSSMMEDDSKAATAPKRETWTPDNGGYSGPGIKFSFGGGPTSAQKTETTKAWSIFKSDQPKSENSMDT